MKKQGIYFFLALCWTVILTVLLTLPGSAIPKVNWLDRFQVDKWVHVALFSLLVILWSYAMGKKYPRERAKVLFMIIAVLAIVYGTGMEVVQKYFVTNRSFDLLDIAADAGGCVAGYVLSITSIKK